MYKGLLRYLIISKPPPSGTQPQFPPAKPSSIIGFTLAGPSGPCRDMYVSGITKHQRHQEGYQHHHHTRVQFHHRLSPVSLMTWLQQNEADEHNSISPSRYSKTMAAIPTKPAQPAAARRTAAPVDVGDAEAAVAEPPSSVVGVSDEPAVGVC